MSPSPRESTHASRQREEAAHFWDEQSGRVGPETWFFHQPVRRYINRSISGDERAWPLEWLESYLRGERFDRALSVGCGCGALERDLLQRGLCQRIDAFDISLGSLQVARRRAAEAGLEHRVHYFALDANAPALPERAYDAVFCHQCLHHVAKLEKLLRGLLRALRPGGLLYADELVGPSRHEWDDRALSPAVEAYRELVPAELRMVEPLPIPFMPDDPSEAIRSSEILPQLRIGFAVETLRPYGGNLLALICPYVRWDQAVPDLIQRLIGREEEHLARHGESHYAIVVARPKGGWKREWAGIRYLAEPKLKRIGRELRGLSRPQTRALPRPLNHETIDPR
ncbi:MAG: methyltransferase domain-containing protein [bacterium]|nr:methyltransferase domain-containing protein [bacterium]